MIGRRGSVLLASFVAISSAAAAPSATDVQWALTNRGATPDDAVRFGFDSSGVHPAPTTWTEADGDLVDLIELRDPTIAKAADGSAAWVATRARRGAQCAGLKGTIDQCRDYEEPAVNALVLFDKPVKSGDAWRPVAVHSGIPQADKAIAKAIAGGATLDAVPSKIDPSAADVAALFQKSFADPKQLAASVSPRSDVVLVGSAPNEKWVGKRVAATLGSWKLAFTVHDGIAAGTTSSKKVAWVAANVDARPVTKPDAKPTPYRVMCIYEKTTEWKLVAVEFSFVAIL